MGATRRAYGGFALRLLLATFLVGPSVQAQSTATKRSTAQSTMVVLAVDLRELNGLRDVGHVGDVFFRRIDGRQRNVGDGYDLVIKGSVAADWKSLFGADDNRAPAFAVEPGTYIIEKINIGSGPTTIGSGIDAQTHAPRFGSFAVRDGEVLNLGRLIVHMHWYERYFDAKVEDNTAEARNVLANANPALAAKLQTRLLRVVSKFPFKVSGGRL